MLNASVLHEKLPRILAPLALILGLLLVPSVVLFVFFVVFIFHEIYDRLRPRYNRDKSKRLFFRDFIFCTSNRKKRSCKILGTLLIWLPFWTFVLSFSLVIGSILTCLAVVPAYFWAIIVTTRMLYWWCKNKRVKPCVKRQQAVDK